MKKSSKIHFRLLIYAVILHLFSLICSVYRDTYRWANGYRNINYWILLFSWWCAQTSLITIIYFIRRAFRRTPPNYFDKVFSLIVINANIIVTSMFTYWSHFGNFALT